jgi:hypothetical protein
VRVIAFIAVGSASICDFIFRCAFESQIVRTFYSCSTDFLTSDSSLFSDYISLRRTARLASSNCRSKKVRAIAFIAVGSESIRDFIFRYTFESQIVRTFY